MYKEKPGDGPTYKDFKKAVFRNIEDCDVAEDEVYPTALFIVDKEYNSEIITLEEIAEEQELDDDFPMNEIIEEIMPTEVAERGSKFFALVFPADYEGEESVPIVAVMLGALFQSEIFYAHITFEDGEAELDEWEEQNPQLYPELTIPFRRAITYQG